MVEGGGRPLARPRARCGSTRARTGSCRTRGRRPGRRRRPSGATSRRRRRVGSTHGDAGGVLPRPPVVVPVAALDLVGGGGRAPAEPVGETAVGHRCVGTYRTGRGWAPTCRHGPGRRRRPRRRCSTSSRSRSTSSGASARRGPPAGVRRPGRRPGARRRRPARSSADRPVHSLHAYFLRPGDPTVPILYEVDRIRDGRSFTTRRVVAIQHGQADLQPVGLVPRPRGRARPPAPDAATCPPPDDAARRSTSAWRRAGTRCSATWYRPAPADRHPPRRLDPPDRERRRCRRTSRCGCGPTGGCPTTRCCTPACSPTRRDMTLLDTTLLPHGGSWSTPTTDRWPASTTPCGSTGRSGPTSGCSTTRTPRRRRAAGAWRAGSSSPATARSVASVVQEGLIRAGRSSDRRHRRPLARRGPMAALPWRASSRRRRVQRRRRRRRRRRPTA